MKRNHRKLLYVSVLAIILIAGTAGIHALWARQSTTTLPAKQPPPIPEASLPEVLPAQNPEPSVGVRDGQVYFGDRKLTDTPGVKQLPVLSPDGKRVAFCVDDGVMPRIGIVEIDRKATVLADLGRSGHNGASALYWLSGDRVGLQAHLNPSTEIHYVVDANAGRLQQTDYGVGFTWDKAERHLYYMQLAPHFASWEAKGQEKLMRNGQVLYASPALVLLSPRLRLAADDTLIAFYEYANPSASGRDQAERSQIVIGRNAGDKLSVLKKIEWDAPPYVILSIDDSSIKVRQGSEQITYNWKTGQVIDRRPT
ncbi:MAG: TolB family protein [Bacillota bacterium]